MKIRYFITVLVLSLLFACEESRYDTLDFSSIDYDVVLEEPLNFTVQGSNNYIMLWWNYPLNQTISVLYSVYRSESEDGEFSLLSDDLKDYYYYDNAVEPGKTYWYKVRAKSILYGESDFSQIKSGMRKGRGVDTYDKESPNNKKENSTKIELDVLYKSSLYISHDATADDYDYYTMDAKKGDILKITIKYPSLDETNVATLSSYDLNITSDLKEITNVTGQSLTYNGNAYLIFFSRDTPIYICISPDSVSPSLNKTGDYDLIVSKVDSSELFPIYSTSSVSYVKIFWSSYFSQMASKYIVQRREKGSEEWINIEGSLTPYRLDVQSEFAPNITQMYDRSAEVEKVYDYRIAAYLETSYKVDGEEQKNEIIFYSSIAEDVQIYKNQANRLPEDAADNIDFDNALEITLDNQINGAIDTEDCRYYKVLLEAEKTYSFSVLPYSSAGKVLFSVDFFGNDEHGNKNKLLHIPQEEASIEYGKFLYTVPKDAGGDYWLCIDGNNTKGLFSIVVKESES